MQSSDTARASPILARGVRMSTLQAAPAVQAHDRVEMLDLLRLLAVLAVLLFHYGFRGAAADGLTSASLPALEPIAKYGYLGVQMFFVISGFVIAYSANGRTAVTFAIARIARIYPGFLLCMSLTFLVTLALGAPRFETTIWQWLANIVVVAPALKQPFMDGAYWSIVYEITFYGWIYALLLAGWLRRRIGAIVLVWLALSLMNELVLGSGLLRRLLLTDESGFFAAGLLLYEMYAGRRGQTIQILFVASIFCSVAQALIGLAWLRGHFEASFDNTVVAVLCVAAIAAVALAIRVRSIPLPSGIVLAIGGLTYPLYLLHQHIGYIALNHARGLAAPAILIAAVMLVMIVLSWAIWRYFERPSQRFTKALLSGSARQLGLRIGPPPASRSPAAKLPPPAGSPGKAAIGLAG